MKSSETEREITELIKTTLDNYQEDYIPGAWENFVSIRKRKKKIIFLRIASGIAACLIIGLLGLQYFSSDHLVKQDTAIVKNDRRQKPLVKDSIDKTDAPQADKAGSRELLADQNTDNRETPKSVYQSAKTKVVVKDSNDAKNKSSQLAEVATQLNNGAGEKNSTAIPSSANVVENTQKQSGNRTDSTVNKADSKPSKPAEKKAFSEQELLRRFAANDIQSSEKRKIRVGINFSPGVSSTQMGSAFTYSGGVSTDIKLFSNILLSTGLQIEHQSVKNGNNATASLSAARTKADLVNLDLPLNITWKFISGKSKSFYVSGGVSSLAYLSEKYDKTISIRQIAEVKTVAAGMEKLSYKMENIETKSETTEPSFNSLDIAGRLNLIFGMEQRLSPKLYLHLEPYMKIPVSGLATENLRFSTGGVTCKISF